MYVTYNPTFKFDYYYNLSFVPSEISAYNYFATIDPDYDYFFEPYPIERVKNMQTYTVVYEWDTVNLKWSPWTKGVYYYSDFSVTSVDEAQSTRVALYPNPCTDYVIADILEGNSPAVLSIVDISGSEVLSLTLSSGSPVSLMALSPGVYMYTLDLNGEVFRGKLLKE